ncbi:MAG: hypothetical protein IJQ79_07145, partial [Bacteroidales bacterium]|nr:hypothetical protein [Bacteroidales bacterium]
MEKRELLFDGNEKQVFATSDPQLVIFRFKDVVTAYNNVKRAHVQRKGKVNKMGRHEMNVIHPTGGWNILHRGDSCGGPLELTVD